MAEKKGLGLLALVGMVVSSCIGSGVFATAGQLANAASPGGALVSWLIAGLGFLFLALALALANLGDKKPEINGLFQYATEGFGPFAGFVSGWGYWLSAWLGNVGFATGIGLTKGEMVAAAIISLLGIISIPMTMAGIIPVF